jgi:transposase
VAEHAFDAIALTVEALAVADRFRAVGFRRDDGLDPALLQVVSDRIGVVSLIGKKSLGWLLWEIDQCVVGFAVRRFAGREMESDGPSSGITETMNFTGEPAPRAAKSALMNPPYGWPAPPAELGRGDSEIGGLSMDIAVLGIDLGKNSCSIVGLDGSGKVIVRRRMQRKTIVTLAANLSPCIVAMEACCGAHHLGRVLSAQGHTVRLMSPEYVRPYVKAQKNDDRDAEAIAEAATRPTMRFVALKSEGQLDMQTLHRARDRAVGERTSLMNQLRAVLLERGVIVPQGRARLRVRVSELLRQGAEELSSRIRLLIDDMMARWQLLDERIAAFDAEFAAEVKQNEAARRLTGIPGIGALNATALVAAVGDAQTFSRGRDLAAWLGLVPRQATTGGKPRLLGITKRGSKYLRKMLIQGARAALPTLSRSNTRLGQWLRGLLARAHSNTVVVALAAKMARTVWALLRYGTTFEPRAIAI